MVSAQSMMAPVPPDPTTEDNGLNSKGLILRPGDLLAAHDQRIDFECLRRFAGKSLVHPHQLDRSTVVELCKFSALLERTEIASHHPLDGKICITAFFEASTRTRLSFESAVLRLDGKLLSVPDGKVTGVAKGESLEDIGEMFNSYGDLVIMRHPETDSVERLQTHLSRPLINAGNGSGEHPTQALLDWYALLKWRPDLSLKKPAGPKLHLGIVGTPGSMRAVKSFLRLSLLFGQSIEKITVVSEMYDPLGPGLRKDVEKSKVALQCTDDLSKVLPELDIIYMNSIAFLGDSYREMDSRFRLDAKSPFKKGAVVMHPLARRQELSESLDATDHNLYFAQAAGAVFLRQALLVTMLDRIPALPRSVVYLTS
jgi:aspartate carbamoyltransferase catalytic subunit